MNRPNIVLVMSDQHRWDFMGYEANGVTMTPHLDRLAAAGTAFRSAYCTSPLCSPSRAAIASGRYGMNSGCFTNLHELPPGTPSFVQQLRANGYHTCAIGKTHMEIHAYDSNLLSHRHRDFMESLGWAEIHETAGEGMVPRGVWDSYTKFLAAHQKLDEVIDFFGQWHYFMDQGKRGAPDFACHEWPLADELNGTSFVGNRVIEWLHQRPTLSPFFLHVGFTAPHSPIAPEARFVEMYRECDETPAWGNTAPSGWLAEGRRGYRAMISHVDSYVGQIVDCLAERGLAENTIVVYMSDHGEMAGDHGRYSKTCFFEGAARVPMIIAGAGLPNQEASMALVETIDLGRTLCDLCGIEPHQLDQGRSLAPLLRGETRTHRETVYCEMGCDKMLRDEQYKLMWGDPGLDTRELGRLHLDKPVNIPPSPARLYDLQADPHELNDLAADGAHQALLSAMLAKLLTRLNENTQAQPNKSRGEYRPLPH